MNKVFLVSTIATSALAAKAGEMWSSSYSFSSSSCTDGSGRTVTDSSEDGGSWGTGSDGQVLFDDWFHDHQGHDSDFDGIDESRAQVIDLSAGDDFDQDGIVMERGGVTVIVVDCDPMEYYHWVVDHGLEQGLYRVEIDDAESRWGQFDFFDGFFDDEDSTCEITV